MTAGLAAQFSDVFKIYGNGVEALGPIDLSIARGDFVALLGPSGCGKSSALRLIAGLLKPSRGSVKLWGATADARPRIGFVFQEPTLMPWATVEANVALPLTLGHVPPSLRAARVREALGQVGLADVAQRHPRELSGGMKMRVSIARALVTDPDFLLMDEPFAALDEITRFQLNDDLRELWQRLRKTIVFVTHSVFESAYLAQRIVVMTPRPGRIAAEFSVAPDAPRGPEFRMSAAYLQLCREVSDALARAHGGRAA